MPIFYKAVNVDGFDFYSGTIDYASLCGTDRQLPVKSSFDPHCCSSTVYHASTSKADTLIGGSWPCRLFEVEGEPVAEEDNKRGFLTLKVIRELPAWEALGPNGQEVAALIERAEAIAPEQASALHAARDAARDAAWHAARDAAWGAARDAARDAAWHAARDAALALIVKDLISTEHFNLLYGSWSSMMDGQ